jgi:glycosyltransferase involved in cell wall biosynthesis
VRLSLAMLVRQPPIERLVTLVDYMSVITDDIVIIDTGSDDDVVRKLMKLPFVRVFYRVWRDDFAWARNEGLKACLNEWTLVLDPDELPSQPALQWIWETVNRPTTEFDAYQLWWVNYWDGVRAPDQEMYWHARLFRTGQFEFFRPVHELLRPIDPNSEFHGFGRAPQDCYIIHSKTAEEVVASDNVHAKIGMVSR